MRAITMRILIILCAILLGVWLGRWSIGEAGRWGSSPAVASPNAYLWYQQAVAGQTVPDRIAACEQLAAEHGTDAYLILLITQCTSRKAPSQSAFDEAIESVDVGVAANIIKSIHDGCSDAVLLAVVALLDDPRTGRWSGRTILTQFDGTTPPLREVARATLQRITGGNCDYDKAKWQKIIAARRRQAGRQ